MELNVKAREGYTVLDVDGYPITDELGYYKQHYSAKYGKEIGEWLAYQILRYTSQDKDASHIRVADVQDKQEVEKYNQVKRCCLVTDLILTHKSGRKFLFGFNSCH